MKVFEDLEEDIDNIGDKLEWLKARSNRHRDDINSNQDQINDLSDAATENQSRAKEDRISIRALEKTVISLSETNDKYDSKINRCNDHVDTLLFKGITVIQSAKVSVQSDTFLFNALIQRVNKLEKRLEMVEFKPSQQGLNHSTGKLGPSITRSCTGCSQTIYPTKPSHKLCQTCYLKRKQKPCKSCSKMYNPKHGDNCYCSNCTTDNKHIDSLMKPR